MSASAQGNASSPSQPHHVGAGVGESVAQSAQDETGSADTASHSLRVLMVASEALPYSKSGGLADVAAALPAALGKLGHDVLTVTPRYRGVQVSGDAVFTAGIWGAGGEDVAQVFVEAAGPNLRVALIDCPALFDRDGLYGVGTSDYPDNPWRFAVLAHAAFLVADRLGFDVDIVHAHEWQGGLAPYFLETRYRSNPRLARAASVFTIHNLAYQGLCDKAWVPRLGLEWRHFHSNGFEHWGQLSLLKTGINFSDRLTTVSPRYAQEILTAEQGFGFEGVLSRRRDALVGIVNGIDVDQWNPAEDPHLPVPFDADHLAGKRAAKRAVLQAYGLPEDERQRVPLVGMIARMVDQKGLDLVAHIAHELPFLGAQVVVLGTGDARYQDMWSMLASRYPDRIGAKIGYDESLAHLIEAGADLFLMPSRFEPCGLNQMYSLRYGTLPLVRATGGLDDTVENFEPTTGEGTGFKFWDYTPAALLGTLRWALALFCGEPESWERMQRRGMRQDFSWTASARSYVRVYRAARRSR